MKIIEYKISNWRDVNDYISEGWQPFGSPMKQGSLVEQAMVKYEKPENISENKFKSDRWSYYIKYLFFLEDGTERYTKENKFYDMKHDDMKEMIDQEWVDYLDGETL